MPNRNRNAGTIFLKLTISIIVLSGFSPIQSQQTIMGKITDVLTNEPVGFANVIKKGTYKGTISDFNGNYSLPGIKKGDTVQFSFLGYETKEIGVKADTYDFINVQLTPSVFQLEEVVVKPGENPAHAILRKVWANSDLNHIKNLSAYEYVNYSRSTVYLRKLNYKDTSENVRGLFKKEYNNYAVSTGEEGLPAIPAYSTESYSEVYHLASPRREFTFIKAVTSKGLAFENTDLVSQLTGKQESFYFFDNSVEIMDKSFISPVSKLGLWYYKYYLIDSMFIDNKYYCYEIHVVPKRKEDPVFKGTIWINDTSFALKRISVEVGKRSDLNFIQRIKIQQDYEPEGNAWFPVKTRFMADAVNIFVNNYSEKNNFIINQPRDLSFYGTDQKISLESHDFEPQFWDTHRVNSYEHLDSISLQRIDSLKQIDKIRISSKLIEASIKGYYDFGSFEAGPYLLIYNHNEIEGDRFRFGGRTNINFSKSWILNGYLAYGFKDNKIKGSGQVEYFLSKKNWSKAGVQYRNDIENVGAIDEFYSQSSFLTFAATFGGSDKLVWSEVYRGWLEKDITNDLSGKLVLTCKSFNPVSPDFIFEYFTDNSKTTASKYYSATEISLNLRYQPQTTWVLDGIRRFPVNFNKAPVFNLSYHHGFNNVLNGDFIYDKISAGIFHNLTLAGFGTFVYEAEYSKFFGQLPYPMLTILTGNRSVFRSNKTYNLMNYGEFVTDETLELFYSWHMDGLILNKVPLIKRLHWRTVTTGHFAFGSFDEKNNGFYEPLTNTKGILPEFDQQGYQLTKFNSVTWSKPYMELSYGIENIFRFIRVDLVHRLNYLNLPDTKQFAVKVSGVFRF